MVRVVSTFVVLLAVSLAEARLGFNKICKQDSQFKDVCLNAGCKCETKAGMIDLTPMTSLSKLKASMLGGSFDYNPCKPFSESLCKNVLMCERSLLSSRGAPVAVASGVRFSQCGDGMVLRYKAKAVKKSADVYLTCNKTTDGALYYMGMQGLTSNHYEFEMQSKYACAQAPMTTPKTTMPSTKPTTQKSTPKSTPSKAVTTHKTSPKPTPTKTSPKPTPRKTTPAKTSPKSTPGKTTPVKTSPKPTPGKTTPAKTSPKPTPGKTTPAKTSPKSTPGKTTPAKTSPKSTPGKTTPAKTTPGKTTPRKTTPKKTSPKPTPAKTSPKMPKTTTPKIPKTTPGGAASSINALPSLLVVCSLLALRRFI